MLKSVRIVLQLVIALSLLNAASASAADGSRISGWFKKLFSGITSPLTDDSGTSDSNTPITASSKAAPSTTDSELCSLNGRERLWAQKRIDADLMAQYIDAHQLRDPQIKTRIYVLDTGFDSAQLPNMIHAGSMSLESGVYGTKTMDGAKEKTTVGDPNKDDGVSLVGDPAHDAGGHGTNVASTIGAKDGLGVAPHADITVYRITSSDLKEKAETTGDDFINYALLRACRKGHEADPSGLTIINQSWIDRSDEMGVRTFESVNPDAVKTLLKTGCLLVKAAGNSSFRAKAENIDAEIESPVLHVAATQAFDDYASFSSTGFVSAPGENIYALESHIANSLAPHQNACDQSDMDPTTPKTFIDGTSFATPITAGVASEVAGVLRTKHRAPFENLHGAQKISLVVRIIKASEQFGNINALRAVMIAERWDEDTKSLSSVEALQALLTDSPPDICTSQKNPREAFSACSSVQSVANAQALATQALSQKRYETSAGYLRAAMDLDTENASQADLQNLKESFVKSYLGKILDFLSTSGEPSIDDTDSMGVLRNNLGASFSEYLLPAHIIATQEQAQGVLFAALASWSTETFLERGPGRGSEAVLQSLVDDISLYKSMNPPSAVDSLLNHLADFRLGNFSSAATFNANEFTALIRIVNELQKRSDFQDNKATLNKIDERIMTALDQNPAFFGGQIDLYAIGGEIYENRGYVFDLIKRNEAELAPILSDADPSHYGMIKIQYILENPTLLPQESAYPFLLKLSKIADTTKSWAIDLTEMKALIASNLITAFSSDSSLLPSFLNQIDWTVPSQIQFIDSLLTSVAQPIYDFQISHVRAIPDSLQPRIALLKTLLSSSDVHNSLADTMYGKELVGHLKVQVDDAATVLPRDLVALVNQW